MTELTNEQIKAAVSAIEAAWKFQPSHDAVRRALALGAITTEQIAAGIFDKNAAQEIHRCAFGHYFREERR